MMLKKGRKTVVSLLLATAMTFSLIPHIFRGSVEINAAVNGDGTDEVNEAYHRKLNLQPLAPAFRYDTMMAFDPEKDPDAKYNRATVPLAKRFQGVKINPLASEKARITSCAIMSWNHDQAGSNGGDDFNVYAFDNWQLLDSLIFWAGTDEGIFALPSPDVVNAAHRNGVPVYATVGFPWGGGHSDSIAELRKMCSKEFAEKMADIAIYYGFDGYFFNQETSGCTEQDSKNLAEMLKHFKRYAKSKGHDLKISWYDSMANSGSVNYQNAVNSKNDIWVKPDDDGIYAVDEFFMNYNWGSYQVEETVNTMNGLGRDPYDAYAGLEVQQRGYKTRLSNLPTLLDNNKQARLSIALYAPNGTMGSAASPSEFYKEEEMFYTGPQGDPSKADDSAEWKGMARFVADKSSIIGDKFISRFVAGHGKNFYKNGKEVRKGEWHNRSLQSIMPTWRWWIRDQKGSRIEAAYDFDNVWYGGNSLKFYGNLDAGSENKIMLYSTDLDVKDSSRLKVTYKGSEGADIAVAISTEADYRTSTLKEFPLKGSSEWTTEEISLADLSGSKIHALAFVVKNETALTGYQINLGEISVLNASEEEINTELKSVKALRVDEKLFDYSDMAQARISWEAVEGATGYNVYQVNKDGEHSFLGESVNNLFHIRQITRTKENARDDNITSILVAPVNEYGVEGEKSSIDFVWPMNVGDSASMLGRVDTENVALGATVTGVSASNDAEPADKALDGTSKGNSKWCASNRGSGWMTIDLGSPKTIQRVRIEHAEMGGEAKNMNTVSFNIQYQDESGTWKIAKDIDNTVQDAVSDFKIEPITAQNWKLEIKDSGRSAWGAIRIYEWQMFETPELPKTAPLPINAVTAKPNPEKESLGALDFTWIEDGSTIRVYKEQSEGEALLTQVVEKSGPVTLNDIDYNLFLTEDNKQAGRLYYTIQTPGSQESDRQIVQFVMKGQANLTVHFIDAEAKIYSANKHKLTLTDPISGKVVSEIEYLDAPVELSTGTYVADIDKAPLGFELKSRSKIFELKNEEDLDLQFEIYEKAEHRDLREAIEAATNLKDTNELKLSEDKLKDLDEKIKAAEQALNDENQTAESLKEAEKNLKNFIEFLKETGVEADELVTVTAKIYKKISADNKEKAVMEDEKVSVEDRSVDEIDAADNLVTADDDDKSLNSSGEILPVEDKEATENVVDTEKENVAEALAEIDEEMEVLEDSSSEIDADKDVPDILDLDDKETTDNEIDLDSTELEKLSEREDLHYGDRLANEGENVEDKQAESLNEEKGEEVAEEGKEDSNASDIEGYEYLGSIEVKGKDGEHIRDKLAEAIANNPEMTELLIDHALAFENKTANGEKYKEAHYVFSAEAEIKTYNFLFDPYEENVEKPTESVEPSETTEVTEPTESTEATESTEVTEPANPTEPTEVSGDENGQDIDNLRAVLASLISRGNAYVPMQNSYPEDIYNQFHAALQEATLVYNSGRRDEDELKKNIERLTDSINLLIKSSSETLESSKEDPSKDKGQFVNNKGGGNKSSHQALPATGEKDYTAILASLIILLSCSMVCARRKVSK